MSRERLIRISQNRIFITPDVSLPLSQTNIPSEETVFRQSEEAYWRVEVTGVDQVQNSVTLRVVDYHPDQTGAFSEQSLKHEVESLLFEPFDWDALEGFLSVYRKSEFQGLILEKEEDPDDDLDEVSGYDVAHVEFLERFSASVAPPANQEPVIEVIEAECWILFKEARFYDGYVEFMWRPSQLPYALEFKVSNPHVLREFEYVKQYFEKVFGDRVFKALVTVTLKDDNVQEKTATSSLLESIDESTVSAIRDCRALTLIKKPRLLTRKKSTFTVDDVFDNFESVEGHSELVVFRQSEQDILALLANQEGVRNKRQLEYLAREKQSPDHVIRFALKPRFGFIFCFEGAIQNHFCWELLDSNATYVWSLAQNQCKEDQFERIDHTMAKIRDMGRQRYRQAYAHGEIDSDIDFNTIAHQGIESEPEEAFNLWQEILNRLLI